MLTMFITLNIIKFTSIEPGAKDLCGFTPSPQMEPLIAAVSLNLTDFYFFFFSLIQLRTNTAIFDNHYMDMVLCCYLINILAMLNVNLLTFLLHYHYE